MTEMFVSSRHGAGNIERGRLAHLDGLRGVAILMVLLFHAYARWTDLLPFGAALAVPPIAQGWVGVQLFFVISGFVIFLTLERSRSLGDFAMRRWRRLLPAMLIATAVIVLSAPLLDERPQGPIRFADVLVGLTFLDPKWWLYLRMDVAPIEGAFWSLFVEVQFYAVAGSAYFLAGRRGALVALGATYVAAEAVQWGLLDDVSLARRVVFAVTDRLGALHYPWFISGAFLYVFAETRDRHWLWLGCSALVVAVLISEPAGTWLAGKIAFAAVGVFFVAALLLPAVQRHLACGSWQFLGFVSYPLYLVHENMMVALTVKLGHIAPGLPGWALPLLPMAWVIVVAWCIARFAEPALSRAIAWRGRGAALIPAAGH